MSNAAARSIAIRAALAGLAAWMDFNIHVVDGLDSPFPAPREPRNYRNRSKYKPRIDTPKRERNKPSGAEVDRD